MDLQFKKFSEIDLNDDFFSSLRADYDGFNDWFIKKSNANEQAIVAINPESNELLGFLYLKTEEESLHDLNPSQPSRKRLKIGTMKIIPHGTRLGERFIKKIFDYAFNESVYSIYVTVFPKHKALTSLFKHFGFHLAATKETSNGTEDVYAFVIDPMVIQENKEDAKYPFIKIFDETTSFYILAIYPIFHTRLFPDSKLNTESFSDVIDTSSANSIEKAYITNMRGTENIKTNDVLCIYRTASGKNAEYTSVITSVCVVTSTKHISDYVNEEEFVKDLLRYSVFSEDELITIFKEKKYTNVIKMTYNMALKKRINRHTLIEDLKVINRSAYAGFMSLSKEDFLHIINRSESNARLIID